MTIPGEGTPPEQSGERMILVPERELVGLYQRLEALERTVDELAT